MLTEKDYCDYETCVALKELGYIGSAHECECFGAYFNFGKDIFTDSLDNTEIGTDEFLRVPLFLAQKWLREEKKIEVNAFYENPVAFWRFYILEIDSPDLSGTYAYDDAYMSYEEALLEGIKEAIKLLKTSNSIN